MNEKGEPWFPFLQLMNTVLELFPRQVSNRSWFKFAVLSAALAWAVTYAVFGLLSLLVQIPPAPAQPARRSAVEILLGGVVATPLLENLLVVAALAVLGNWLSKRDSALVVTVVAVLLHAVFASWSGVAALVLFAVLTFSYQAWKAQGEKLAFLVIFLQHALFNLPGIAEAALHALT